MIISVPFIYYNISYLLSGIGNYNFMAKKLQYHYPMLGTIKKIGAIVLLGLMVSCANDKGNTTDATGTVEQVKDTNHLVTDSVEMPDTNTAEIDEMKKRN